MVEDEAVEEVEGGDAGNGTLRHHSIQRQRVAIAAKTAAMVLQKSVNSTKKSFRTCPENIKITFKYVMTPFTGSVNSVVPSSDNANSQSSCLPSAGTRNTCWHFLYGLIPAWMLSCGIVSR
jgi:hypothetical protein